MELGIIEILILTCLVLAIIGSLNISTESTPNYTQIYNTDKPKNETKIVDGYKCQNIDGIWLRISNKKEEHE